MILIANCNIKPTNTKKCLVTKIHAVILKSKLFGYNVAATTGRMNNAKNKNRISS